MIVQIYAIHDRVGGFFSNPFFTTAAGLARRIAMEVANDPNTQIGRHPHDFALYCLGEFDNNTGAFQHTTPEFVCTCLSLIQTAPAPTEGLFAPPVPQPSKES